MKKNIQLSDIAKELNLSTSTISRVISNKGNISEETRKKVKDYIQQINYHPNLAARSLAQKKTFNIGVIIPEDAFLSSSPFFQICLMGICEEAVKKEYNVIVSSNTNENIDGLKRIASSMIVDGIVLMRVYKNDRNIEYLKSINMPFTVIGTTSDSNIVDIDNDHTKACEALVDIIIKKSKRIALLIGNLEYMVNRQRRKGFINSLNKNNIPVENELIIDNVDGTNVIQKLELALNNCVDAIICGDDVICIEVINTLEKKGLIIGRDIKVASLYESQAIKNKDITAVSIDIVEVGRKAADVMIDLINTGKVTKVRLGYNILERNSTN